MYSIAGYGMMIADRARVAAYTEALERSITPGCSVLDIGTGTGYFAMLACRLGAGKVYAVEPDDVIDLARTIARDNGYGDRIEFIQDLTTNIDLPEQVDVVVSDLRTVLPWFQHHIPTIADARKRLLKSGGALIPQRDTAWGAVVEMPEFYAQFVGHQPADTDGFDMSAARRVATSGWTKARARPEQLLTDARQWAVIDFNAVVDPAVSATLEWTVERSGTAHGIIAWFDTILLEGIGFSNAPGESPKLYGHAFFPWPEPVEVSAGDTITVDLRANLVDDDYIWTWNSRVTSQRGGDEKAAFSQNNFRGPANRQRLRQRAASHVPTLNGREQVDRFILGRLDNKTSLGSIAEALSAAFPDDYPTWESALGAVADLSARYSN